MNNGFIVVPGASHPINIEHTSTAVPVPAGTTDIRFSLVSYQPTRDKPQFGAILQALWTDANGRTPAKAGRWQSLPKDSWEQSEIDEGLPISGHAVGSGPGTVPHDVGPFEFAVEGSPAVNGNDRPEWATHALLKYTLLGGNNGGPVYVSVVLETFAVDQVGGTVSVLEF